MTTIEMLLTDLANPHSPDSQSAARSTLERMLQEPHGISQDERAAISQALAETPEHDYNPLETQFWAPWD